MNAGKLAKYSFDHMMELSLALSIRVYGILPDVVVRGLIRFRDELYDCYQRAFLERTSGFGAPVLINAAGEDDTGFWLSGVYLDLQLTYSAGQLFSIGPPRLLTPLQALIRFAQSESPARAHPPLNLTQTAIRVAALMGRAPRLRRGPKPHKHAEGNNVGDRTDGPT